MPQQNGKVECSHRTLDKECRNSQAFRKPRSRAFAIKRWGTFSNSQRPQSVLQWRTRFQTLESCHHCQHATRV